MIRFHLDEHVAHAIAYALRKRGIDVTTTTDAELVSASDEQQLEYALAAGRVMFTHDSDFLRLHHQGLAHAGIAIAAKSKDIGEIVRSLGLIHDSMTPEEVVGRVEFI